MRRAWSAANRLPSPTRASSTCASRSRTSRPCFRSSRTPRPWSVSCSTSGTREEARVGAAAMKIGVAKEIKPDEDRVALTPAGALELVRKGHRVVIETGAGAGSALADEQYAAVGARIGSAGEVWEPSELVLKV